MRTLGCAGSSPTFLWRSRCWRTSPREPCSPRSDAGRRWTGSGRSTASRKRHACRIVGQHRGTQRYVPTVAGRRGCADPAIVALAPDYGRYGYRRVTALLQTGGWQVGKDRVQRIWRREGLKVPSRHKPPQPPLAERRLMCATTAAPPQPRLELRLLQARTHDGRSLRILTHLEEHSRPAWRLKVARRINSLGVIEALAEAMCLHGIPKHIRCDNGPEMISKALRKWVAKAGSQIQYIAPGSRGRTGTVRASTASFRDVCLRRRSSTR